MLNNLSEYLTKEEYRISIIPNGIHILYYSKILDITNLEALIYIKNKIIKITGINLYISKLDKNELLIKGTIKKVEINE